MTREIELKLEIDPEDLQLVLADPLVACADSRTRHQVTVYYDTAATRLKKKGWTLRVRNVGGKFVQTVKPVTQSAGLLSRDEVEHEVASLEPDLGMLTGHPILSLLNRPGSERLRQIIRSEVDRTSLEIDRHNSRIQLDLDHGTITADDHSEDFAELELELLEGGPASLIAVARRLADHAPVRLGVLTKAERGLRLANGTSGSVEKAAPVHLNAAMQVAEAFETIVHACLRQYRLNEPLVLRSREAAALHQSRVAMRRLRSALSLFKPAIEDVSFQHLREELRWFTSQLGDARNLDVYLGRQLADEERVRLVQDRDKAYAAVADAMNSPRFRGLLIDLVGWVAMGAWRSSKAAAEPIPGFAAERLDRLWRSITKASPDLHRMDAETRHQLRIQSKKMRYAVEFFRDLLPDADGQLKRFAAAIEDIQETLGILNDLATARTFGAGSGEENWPLGSVYERRYLMAADGALKNLQAIGPFWRSTIPAGS